MGRIRRIVVPGIPHHVTQRGNRRQRTFFSDDDHRSYLALAAEWFAREGLTVWAWCLMPNHVHLVVVPEREASLARALGEAHRRYARRVNRREGWTGHLWQERFGSCPLDPAHLFAAVRYVELNPVRARLVARPEDWNWSSARAHLAGTRDRLLDDGDLRAMIADWPGFLAAGLDEAAAVALRCAASSGRALGGDAFVANLEARLGRRLRPEKRGPKGAAGIR